MLLPAARLYCPSAMLGHPSFQSHMNSSMLLQFPHAPPATARTPPLQYNGFGSRVAHRAPYTSATPSYIRSSAPRQMEQYSPQYSSPETYRAPYPIPAAYAQDTGSPYDVAEAGTASQSYHPEQQQYSPPAWSQVMDQQPHQSPQTHHQHQQQQQQSYPEATSYAAGMYDLPLSASPQTPHALAHTPIKAEEQYGMCLQSYTADHLQSHAVMPTAAAAAATSEQQRQQQHSPLTPHSLRYHHPHHPDAAAALNAAYGYPSPSPHAHAHGSFSEYSDGTSGGGGDPAAPRFVNPAHVSPRSAYFPLAPADGDYDGGASASTSASGHSSPAQTFLPLSYRLITHPSIN